MKKFDNIRLYAWLEFIIWLFIIAICVFCIRYHNYKEQKQYKSYQIFMNDVDGLIVGSPVRFLGVQIGHVTKIQLVSSEINSDIYIKFIITQKDLELPLGSVATVEGSGLGGSKSLEVYPPKDNSNSDKIIASKDSTRLNKVMGLFNEIFKDLEEIFSAFGHASHELSKDASEIQKNMITPADADMELIKLNKQLDSYIEIDKNIKKHIPKQKKGAEDELGESKSNK